MTQVAAGVRGESGTAARLRLECDGRVVGVYPSVEELAKHVDLASLVEELPAPADRR